MLLPPGPRGALEVFSFLRASGGDPDVTALALAERYGPVASLRIGRELVVLVSDPELIGEVLLDREAAYLKDAVTRGLAEVLGKGLLTSEGELWRKQRKLIAPSLGKARISTYADTMVELTARYAARLRDGEARDAHADMSRLTLEIVLATLFGAELPGGVQESVARVIDRYMEDFDTLVHSWRVVVPGWVPLPERKRNARAAGELDALVLGIVKARRAEGVRGDDLFSRLLAAKDESAPASGMDDQQLRDEVVTLFVAGHETTANALSWTLLLLAEHPEIDARLSREVRDVLGGRAARAEDAAALPLTRAVIDEAMRLYPPAHILGREATRDVRIGRWNIPKATTVLVSPWAMHRERRFFPDPQAFRPDRWLDGRAAGLPRYAYLPFGGGARVCVGNHFALMEMVLVLATIVQRARFERVSRAPVPSQPAVTLRPKSGVPLRVALREGAPATTPRVDPAGEGARTSRPSSSGPARVA
jgi:cytochrome P450